MQIWRCTCKPDAFFTTYLSKAGFANAAVNLEIHL